jgi:hypothetical protein
LQAQNISQVNRQLIRDAIRLRIFMAPLSFLLPPRDAPHDDRTVERPHG